MQRYMKIFSYFLIVLAISFFTLAGNLAVGKGGGSRSGGSSKSSSGWGSSSSSSKKSSSGWGSSSSDSKKSSSGWGSSSSSSSNSSRSGATSKNSAASQASYKKAVSNGTAFKTKDAAQADFKSKYASKYTSKYDTKPETRPAHIPETTKTADGKTVNITYNQQGGGYGYYSGGGPGLGTFIMYDMMSDAIMMNAMMSNHNYNVGGPPAVVHHNSGMGFLGIMFAVIFGIVFIAIAVAIFKS